MVNLKCDQQRLESLEAKKAAHTSCKHCVNLIAKDDRPGNSRDVNPLETIWIIVDETKYKVPAPKTLDELRHTLGARTFYTASLGKCQKKIKEDILVTNISVVQCQ